MSQTKQACKCKKSKKVLSVSVLGVAGMSLAATGAEAAVLSPVTALQPMPFSEEEISDVSLATFHLYDKDSAGIDERPNSSASRRRLAWRMPSWWMPADAVDAAVDVAAAGAAVAADAAGVCLGVAAVLGAKR